MILRWGIIGLGKIAQKFAEDLWLAKDVELVAVASRQLEKAKSFQKKNNAKYAFGSYEELLTCPEVDIVYIATPHDSHMEWGILAMENSLHVLCEKPLAVNTSQVASMLEAAKRNNVFLMEGLWTRFNPTFVSVLQKLKNGAIGKVNYLNADFCFKANLEENNRLTNIDRAGGALLDIGIYPVFLAYSLFGLPIEIKASARFHSTGIDKQTTISLKFEEGMAALSCSLETKSDMTAKIYGENGSVFMHHRWHETDAFDLLSNEKHEKYKFDIQGNGFVPEIDECNANIKSTKLQSDLWSHQDSLNLISILDKIRTEISIIYPFEK